MAGALGTIGLGGTIVGGFMQAMGASQSADSQAAMYNYQANLAKINQELSLQQGAAEAQQYGQKARQQMGQLKAAQGASGIDVNSGSALAVQAGQRSAAEIDNAQIRSNAARTAYNYGTQAEAYSTAASNVESAKGLNIASSILGTVSSVSSKWLQGQQMGLWSSSNPLGVLGEAFGSSTTYPTIANDQT